MRCVLTSVILLAAVVASTPNSAVAGFASEWNFRNGDLAASYGSASMSYWGSTTSGAVSFADDSVGGETKKVMQCNAFTPEQGLLVNSPALSNYTMIWDLYIPYATTGDYGSFLQTDTVDVVNDVDLSFCYKYNRDSNTFAPGFQGQYPGGATFDAWHRVALTVAANGAGSTVSTYIDGVAGHSGTACASPQFIVPSSGFLLFADENSETSPIKLSAFYVTDSVLSASQIAALGGASAAGIGLPVPEPGAMTLAAIGLIGLAAYAWRKRN